MCVPARELGIIRVGAKKLLCVCARVRACVRGGWPFSIWERQNLLFSLAVTVLALCRTATAVDSAMWPQIMLQSEAAMRAVGANQEARFNREPCPYGDGCGCRPPRSNRVFALQG